ncbi:MAG: bacillithiol biosynthesis BshC [Gemmatimonadota bacterium]
MTDYVDAASDMTTVAQDAHVGGESALHVRTVPLGGSRLSVALQSVAQRTGASGDDAADSTQLPQWLLERPGTVDGWRARATDVRSRQGTPDWHVALAPAFAATGAAAGRLSRAAAHGVVITTGQQPGLFGGPAYTWTKAMSALALADRLEAALGIPVAPVFWAATDDADWAEAAVTHLLTTDGLQTVQLPGPATDGVAMMDVPLGDVSVALASLRAACGSAASASVLDEVESAYVPHATIGAAYLQLLRALLEPLGIAVLDASHAATRAAADPFLRRALVRAAAVANRLSARSEDIRAAGFAPQVETLDNLSLVFRTSLGREGRGMDRVRERVPVVDAPRVAREAEPGTLGANVLLRPVLERCLLPTIAYVAGPGEFAYFAQIGPIAEALEAEASLPVPRWAGEIIEPRSARVRERLGITEAMLRDPHEAETFIARVAMPDDVQDALERLRVTLDAQIRAVGSAVDGADSLVHPAVVDGLGRDVTHRLERFERRALAAVKRRESTLMRDVAHVRAAYRPMGASPERVLNLVPVLARHGTGVFALLRREAEAHADRLLHAADVATGAPADESTATG